MSRILVALILFTTPAALANDPPGAALYRTKSCVTCHAKDGSGNTPAGKAVKTPDLRAETVQKKSDDALAKSIADGVGKMPAFGNALTAEQIRDVVAYIRTLKN